jgi:tetratricopeptide (TPR) repeat protein
MGKGEYREAREFFEKILFFQPTNLMAFKNLGVCYNKINDFDKAIVSFNRAINLYAENSDLFTQRGVAYTGKKDLQKALQDFDKAIKLNRINGEAIFERAILYNNVNKNREKALLDLDTACSVGFERACHWQLDKY